MKNLPVFVILSMALAACGTEEEPSPCASAERFDEASGICRPVSPSCDPEAENSIAEECASAQRECFQQGEEALCGLCLPGLRDQDGSCVPVRTCQELDCTAHNRVCEAEGVHQDATCGACLRGAVDDGGVCAVPNCDTESSPGSMVDACAALHRVCAVVPEGATCGHCFHGFVDENGRCRSVRTCADVSCLDQRRGCEPEGSHRDAVCAGCLPGFLETAGRCTADPDANCNEGGDTDSILGVCGQFGRSCVDDSAGAYCGECESPLIEHPSTGECLLPVPCSQLDCAAELRVCVADPFGRCTRCIDGYVEDDTTGDCRAVLGCEQLVCGEGEECAEATPRSDAFCRPDCGPESLWGGQKCVPCPPCSAPGELGVYPIPIASGACICETEPGYYFSRAADIGATRCDADGDGWVRDGARLALEAEDTDPALFANARCELRRIDAFELRNEHYDPDGNGEGAHVVELPVPLALYETNRNDDDVSLQHVWNLYGFPEYGRRPVAAELNRLTKICHDLRTDYNDNASPDVVEYGAQPLSGSQRPEQALFNEMSYFVELYDGWYEEQAGSVYGHYVIQERSRIDDIPIQYRPEDDDRWRSCELRRDAEMALPQPIGTDFASELADEGELWSGMLLPSLFKCIIVEPTPDGTIPTEKPLEALLLGDYRVNRCEASGAPLPPEGNPSKIPVRCELLDLESGEAGIGSGDVVWGGVPYIEHDDSPEKPYVRGCVNECIEGLPVCQARVADPRSVICVSEPERFGALREPDPCESAELCNGLDDSVPPNGQVDENPYAGFLPGAPGVSVRINDPTDPCAVPGGIGPCASGLWQCESGVTVCRPTFQQLDVELCNGIDDNCDGNIDEDEPWLTANRTEACDVPNVVGACAEGRLVCANGSWAQSTCEPMFEPSTDENGAETENVWVEKTLESGETVVVSLGCNGIDDDCDGVEDEPPFGPLGECPEPWAVYHADQDGDGYGDGGLINPQRACMCPYQAEALGWLLDDSDCCDTDANAFPGQTGWFDQYPTGCTTFDYNCDGEAEKRWSEYDISDGCGFVGLVCGESAVGWAGPMAVSCGVEGTYFNGCGDWPSCPQKTRQRTQRCR